MNLLPEYSEPNEADAVLQAALEFVDAFDGGDTNSPQSLLPADAVATKKSEVDTRTYDQRRRQRKKAERERLHSQLEAYEAQLELLRLQRLTSDRGNCLVNPDRSLWSVVAIEEAGKRREAEELNRRLRALLAELLRSTEGLRLLTANESPLLTVSVSVRLWLNMTSLDSRILKQVLFCGGEQQIETVLRGLPRQTGRVPSLLFTNRAAIVSDLKETMKQVVNSTASVFESCRVFEDSNAVNAISCSTRINRQDPIAGPCIEVAATTPLACDLNKAVAVLWSMLVGLELFGSNHLLSFESRQITSRSAEVDYTFGFGKGDTFMTLDGVSLVEKFEMQHGVQFYRKGAERNTQHTAMDELLELPAPEEAEAGLEDVLAFIDTCDVTNVAVCTCTEAESIALSKRKSAQRAYERQRRERKKARRVLLQEQVQELEAQLELLKLERQETWQLGQYTTGSRWQYTASEQAKLRHEAEELNRELRMLLAEGTKATKALRSVKVTQLYYGLRSFQRIQATLERCSIPIPSNLSPPLTSHGSISANLKGVMAQLLSSIDAVFGDWDSVEAISTSSSIKQQDPLDSPYIELQATTPVACDLNTVSTILWEMLLRQELFGPKSSAILSLKKREEAHRVVLLWTSVFVHPSGQPAFRSRGWIMITRSPSNPLTASVIRICSRISKGALGSLDTDEKTDSVLARSKQLQAQTRLERVQQRILQRIDEQTDR
ncbi:hypothetical protein BBJ28_00001155 [Nothophytophthora sp. Chile5]|nr:hypothetical protein BBJ28_00001155 [Nothophytophthora sp. Chile5]